MHLTENDVHIWSVDIARVNPALISSYRAIMSAEELERNQRYRFEKNRFSDCVTRALARDVLSKYADRSPESWSFSKGEHGKPELTNSPVPLRFNLSHTSHHVVCVVTPIYDVGIDIEHTARKNDVLAIADRYFSEQEVTDLFELPVERQADRFFDYWTLKEAYMKASGEGISLGLGNFSFHFDESKAARISFGEKIIDNPDSWSFQQFNPAEDHRMALAICCGRHNKTKLTISQFSTVPLTAP